MTTPRKRSEPQIITVLDPALLRALDQELHNVESRSGFRPTRQDVIRRALRNYLGLAVAS